MQATAPNQIRIDENTDLPAAQTITVSAEQFGASVNATAAQNTLAIQKALNVRGSVSISCPGVVYFSGGLIGYSKTIVRLSNLTTLRLANGSNNLLFKNLQYDAVPVSVSVAWTSGHIATVTWPLHGLSVGDYVTYQTSGTEYRFNTTLPVLAVSDANTYTVYLPYPPTAAPTGVTAVKCDTDIWIEGGTFDYNGANQTVGGNNNTMGIILQNCARSRVNTRVINTNKYGLYLGGVADIDLNFSAASRSDGCKVYGPANNIRGKVSGNSKDDFFSFQANEAVAFPYNKTVGDIFDCDVTVNGNTDPAGASSGCALIYIKTNEITDNIVLRGEANASLNAGVSIKYGADGGSGRVGRVVLDNMNFNSDATAGDQYGINIACPFDWITARGNFNPNSTTQAFLRSNTANANGYRLDVDIRVSSTTFAGNVISFTGTNSGPANLNIRAYLSGSATNSFLLNLASAYPKVINVEASGIQWGRLVNVTSAATQTPTISIDRVVIDTLSEAVNANATINLVLGDITTPTLTRGIIFATNAGGTFNIYRRGMLNIPAGKLTNNTTGAIRLYDPMLLMDLNSVLVTKTVAGQMATTTALAGTIPAGRVAICDGTNWRCVDDRTLLF